MTKQKYFRKMVKKSHNTQRTYNYIKIKLERNSTFHEATCWIKSRCIKHTSKNIGVQNLEKKRRKVVFPCPASSFSSTWEHKMQFRIIYNTKTNKSNADPKEEFTGEYKNFNHQKQSKKPLLSGAWTYRHSLRRKT